MEPTAASLALHHILKHTPSPRPSQSKTSPLFVAIQGPQGVGKTTLVKALISRLSSPPYSYHIVGFSIDDLYYGHDELQKLGAENEGNSLLQGRGLPGTHDVELGAIIFKKLSKINASLLESTSHGADIPRSSRDQDNSLRSQLPSASIQTLKGHTDKVLQLKWNHGGNRLASAGRDGRIIIWHIIHKGDSLGTSGSLERVLIGCPFAPTCLSWSPDDSLLILGAECEIILWEVKTGKCIKKMKEHSQNVGGVCWNSDGAGFVSGGMDRRIIEWDRSGNVKGLWPLLDTRLVDLALLSESHHLVAIGWAQQSVHEDVADPQADVPCLLSHGLSPVTPGPVPIQRLNMEPCVVIYDLVTKQKIWSQVVPDSPLRLSLSNDSRFALASLHHGDAILWDVEKGRFSHSVFRRAPGTGVVQSCFGGTDSSYILSGSKDGKIYIWNRHTGTLLKVLDVHGSQGINSVEWSPHTSATFASCGDDGNVYIWEKEQVCNAERLEDDMENTLRLPSYDKGLHHGQGDRLPTNQWKKIPGPVDIVLLEGWCLGFYPISDNLLEETWERRDWLGIPVSLRLTHGIEDIRAINRNLKDYVDRWYPYFTCLVQVASTETDGLDIIYKWRLQQEHMMKSGNGGRGMTDEQVTRFIDRYMPGYIFFGDGLKLGYNDGESKYSPPWAGSSLKIIVDQDRRPVSTEEF